MGSQDWIFHICVHNEESVEIKVFCPDGTEEEAYAPVRFQPYPVPDFASLNDRSQIRDVGEHLFKSLLADGKPFFDTYTKAFDSEHQRLRIVLEINQDALPEEFAKPWELICTPDNRGTPLIGLAIASGLSFSRRLYQQTGQDHTGQRQLKRIKKDEPLKIALMVSRPSGKDSETDRVLGQFDSAAVAAKLGELQQQGRIDFIRTTAKTLSATLKQHQPHIFHFMGHGRLQGDVGALAFVVEAGGPTFGKPDWKTADAVVDLFPVDSLPLVVILQACEGAKQSESDAFASVASKLLRQGIAIVVAMQYEIPAGVANTFVCRLYDEIVVQQNPVDVAVQEARNLIAQNQSHATPDFATPVIYMNVMDGQLFEEAAASLPSIPEIISSEVKTRAVDLKEVLKPATQARKDVKRVISKVSASWDAEKRRNVLFESGIEEKYINGIDFSKSGTDFAERVINRLLPIDQLHLVLSYLLESDEPIEEVDRQLLVALTTRSP